MAKFEDKERGVQFTLPDRLTVEQQLRFRSAVALSNRDGNIFLHMWMATVPLIEGWECIDIPDPAKVDLAESDPKKAAQIARIIQYVADEAAGHVNNIGILSKNA